MNTEEQLYKRGDIWFIKNSKYPSNPVASEFEPNRPAVIVSNDFNNKHSNMIEVVMLTTQPKKDLPTHVDIIMPNKTCSIALCEQIYSISESRFEQYAATCTDRELQNINKALTISLALPSPEQYMHTIDSLSGELTKLRKELADLKNTPSSPTTSDDEAIRELQNQIARLEGERDAYKNLYANLLSITTQK